MFHPLVSASITISPPSNGSLTCTTPPIHDTAADALGAVICYANKRRVLRRLGPGAGAPPPHLATNTWKEQTKAKYQTFLHTWTPPKSPPNPVTSVFERRRPQTIPNSTNAEAQPAPQLPQKPPKPHKRTKSRRPRPSRKSRGKKQFCQYQ